MKNGFMDPVARAQAELDAMMGKRGGAVTSDDSGTENPGQVETAPAPETPDGEKQPATDTATATVDPKTETPEYWKSRFEVLQGKYNAEVPRLIEQVNALTAQLQDMVQAGKKEDDPSARKPATAEEALANLYDTWGSELTDAIDGLIRARMQNVEEKVSKVETVTAQTAAEKFYSHLDQSAEGWRELNTDPGFLAFLQTPEQFTGMPYNALLTMAFERGDAARVAAIFNYYKSTINPAPTRGKQPNGQQQMPTPDHLTAPAKRGGGDPGPAQNNGPKVFTMAEVNAFYKDLELGRYRGKEAEAAAIEHDILVANQQGRIVG